MILASSPRGLQLSVFRLSAWSGKAFFVYGADRINTFHKNARTDTCLSFFRNFHPALGNLATTQRTVGRRTLS